MKKYKGKRKAIEEKEVKKEKELNLENKNNDEISNTAEIKILNLLGLAMKAGKLVFGFDSVVENTKKIHCVIIAKDASEKTKSKLKLKLSFTDDEIERKNKIKIYELGNIDEISRRIGKTNKAIVGIRDKNFKEAISKILQEDKEGRYGKN